MSPRAKKAAAEEPSYEAAFDELQTIVGQLESGTATLEEALKLYERGQVLVRLCSTQLDRAELRIRELAVKSAGEAPDRQEA